MSPMHKKVSLFWMQWGRVNSRHRVKKETRSMWVKHSHWERTNRFGGIWTRIPAMLATDPRKTANPQKARYTNDGRAQQWTEVIPHSTVDRMGDYFFFFILPPLGRFFLFCGIWHFKSGEQSFFSYLSGHSSPDERVVKWHSNIVNSKDITGSTTGLAMIAVSGSPSDFSTT